MSTCPIFPLEIFDLIIRNLEDVSVRTYPFPCTSPSLSTLCACSLVCRSFVSLCRPGLFRDVEVGPTASESRWKLAQLLIEKPELSRYIRRLSYHRTTPSIPPVDADIAGLLPILQLPNVNTLIVHTDQSNPQTRIRYYDDHGFRKFFDHHLSSGKITSLYLHGLLGAPAFQILTSPNLKTLIADSVIFSQWSSIFPHGRVNPSAITSKLQNISLRETEFELTALSYLTHLQHISFGSGLPAFLNLTLQTCQDNALCFRALHTLAVDTDLNPVLAICSAAKRAGIVAFPVVGSLYINLDPSRSGDLADVTPWALWYHLPALESVNIRLPITRASVRAYCLLRLDHCLRMCKKSLKRLRIQAHVSDPGHIRDVIQPLFYSLGLARGDNAIEVIDIKFFISNQNDNDNDNNATGGLWDLKMARYHVALFGWLLVLVRDRSHKGFRALRKVVVKMSVDARSGESDEGWVRMAEKYQEYISSCLARMPDARRYPFFEWKVESRRLS
ncbi:hypothetical protein CVT24_007580 [Panaeolus cyanescens]|uniref:F-box domain-containing protein n=1 Tax=Panaeolus cyanescens TaxID=181874 RepID=A0A409VQY3_9AGAR|nr:hypothetical protein CVT24_007580 [Panaeolus cyanescens]